MLHVIFEYPARRLVDRLPVDRVVRGQANAPVRATATSRPTDREVDPERGLTDVGLERQPGVRRSSSASARRIP